MNKTKCSCANCRNIYWLATKEYRRKMKTGTKFFCSQYCYKQYRNSHLSLRWAATHKRARKIYVKSTKGVLVCAKCGKSDKGNHVHHKDSNYLNNSRSNLECLCPDCHVAAHHGMTPYNWDNK